MSNKRSRQNDKKRTDVRLGSAAVYKTKLLQRLLQTVRDFVTIQPGLKVISLLISIALWFFVLGSRNVEITKEVPIEVATGPDFVVANDFPEKIQFRLAGPRAFLRNILNRKEEAIRINLTGSKPGLITYRFFNDNIALPIGVAVQSITPNSLVFKLEPYKTKEVPIKLITKNDVPLGLKLNKFSLVKNTIKVRGPESKIDLLTELHTNAFDLHQVVNSGESVVKIDLPKNTNLILEEDSPIVQFAVEKTGVVYRIRNVGIRVLTDKKYKILSKDFAIYVQCTPDELKTLEQDKVFAIADLREFDAGTYDIEPSVSLPGNVKLVKVVPNKLKVKVL